MRHIDRVLKLQTQCILLGFLVQEHPLPIATRERPAAPATLKSSRTVPQDDVGF
jgi:hypothetical protein